MAVLPPNGKFQAFDSAGDPLVGGLLYTYAAGTTTPLATYTDQGGGTPNANPVVLNSRGEANVWLTANTAYKFTLHTAADVLIWTVDNIVGVPDSAGNITVGGNLTVNGSTTLGDAAGDSLTVRPNAVSWTNNPTHSGNHTFSGSLSVNGNTTLGNSVLDTITASAANFKFSSDFDIAANTSDGNDNFTIVISGGGDDGNTRGASLMLRGNEAGGTLVLETGDIGGASATITSGTSNMVLARNGAFTLTNAGSASLSVSSGGVATVSASTATPAGGSTSARLIFGTTSGFGVYYGSGAPTVSAAQGSIYLRSDGSSTSTRLYVNTNGSTGWTNFTSAT